jgi:hypothetical protein
MNGLPVVNINGTSREALVEAYTHALDAVYAAMEALEGISPNARDYQTAKPGELEIARKCYMARFSMMDTLRNELIDETSAIQGVSAGAHAGTVAHITR